MKTPFILALSLLTQIPTPYLATISPNQSGQSVLYYPLVGLIIGALITVPSLLLIATPPLLLASLVLVFWILITGGLHLDGLADSADAWLGGMGDMDKTHQIMKDPLLGSAGTLALISLLLLKFSALVVLLTQHQWSALLLAPIMGRLSILLLLITTPYVRANGMASDMVKHLPKKAIRFLLLIGLGIALFYSLYGLLLVLLLFWRLRAIMLKRINGCTGDTLGATVEIIEMSWLVGATLVI